MKIKENIKSPFVYLSSLLLAFIIFIGIFSYLERFSFFQNEKGVVSGPILAVLIAVAIFWPINISMIKSENLRFPKIIDHFRQSSIFYFLLIFDIYFIVNQFAEYRGSIMYAELLILFAFSVLAIGINAIYLFLIHKRNKAIKTD